MDEVTIGPGESVLVNAENPPWVNQSAVLLVDMERSSGRLAVEEVDSGTRSVIDLTRLAEARMPLWHTRAAVPLGSSRDAAYQLRPEGTDSRLTYHGVLLL